ncbi:MAG: hypothetical protein NTV34_01780 [Proteobacteria bacterium]|nr:hypothetical protein [Pseudomonadota bacterium]
MQIRQILNDAKTSAQALEGLYQLRKSIDPKFSMKVMADRLELRSTGSVSDIITGRRKVPLSVRKKICDLFSLTSSESKALQVMIAFDSAKRSESKDCLQRQLDAAKNALQRTETPGPRDLRKLFFSLEVFCAFGLFNNKPRLIDLIEYFGISCVDDIRHSIDTLVDLGVVRPTPHAGEKSFARGEQTYELTSNQWFIGAQEQGVTHVDFILNTLHHAIKNTPRWFLRSNESAISSTIISVKKSAYLNAIPHIKDTIDQLRCDLESGDADSLIRFNVQVYPTGPED